MLEQNQTRSVYTTNLLLGSKVVDNIKELPDLLRRLALDHVRYCLAANISVKVAKRDIRIQIIDFTAQRKILGKRKARRHMVRDGCLQECGKGEWRNQDVQQGLDIKIVCSQDDLKEHLLVDRNEFLVPF